ncbi:MAG TPA: DegT/DnrJ/EryC1/StrS family aminotransferase [Candidatus Baltobacteraceae bacterium]|nr:DegT/DnrJ/EryC1/StrS family aminotransferase [Candidatus Baltobacteraceae bacterium]
MIPICDLKEQYRTLREQMLRAVDDVFSSGHFINGPNVKALEAEAAAYLGAAHAVALNSGTDALHLALRALDIGPGDEVITTPFTFVATTEAIGIVGATPVFVDIDPRTYNLDVRQIEAAITPRTRAILPVHLYGCPAPMDEILAIAQRRNLAVVEDCAQSIGAKTADRFTGVLGTFGCFSFFPSKNLGAYGDGGMLVTNDQALADRARSLRGHGGRVKYYHEELGVNSRLDEVQAAILRVKLPHLESWIANRRAAAGRYTAAFAASDLQVPVEPADDRHVYHQYTLRVPDRDRVQRDLKAAGVESMIYYPVPLHLQKVHEALGLREGAFPQAERASREVLSIPMYPELTPELQQQVVDAVYSATRREAVA